MTSHPNVTTIKAEAHNAPADLIERIPVPEQDTIEADRIVESAPVIVWNESADSGAVGRRCLGRIIGARRRDPHCPPSRPADTDIVFIVAMCAKFGICVKYSVTRDRYEACER